MTRTLPENVLSDKELAVVRLLADGFQVKQVANRLGISVTAVSMRLRRAADILGTATATQTVVTCARLGLLEPDKHRAARVWRGLTERHSSACALLRPPTCDCAAHAG